MLQIKIVILFPHPCCRLKKFRLASFRETCQWLKFPLNGLRAQSRVSPAVGLLPSDSGPACLGMAFPPFLVKQLYRRDSVVISSFVRTGCTTREWGWLLGRIGYSMMQISRNSPEMWNICLFLIVKCAIPIVCLGLYLLTWRIWWAPNNASKGQMGFNLAFKWLTYKLR